MKCGAAVMASFFLTVLFATSLMWLSLAKGGFTVKNPNKAPLVSAIISLFASEFALVSAFCAESLVFSAICGVLIGIFSLELVRRFQAYRLFEEHKEEFAEILAEIERSINGEL
jgi:crotonobetainyl-CoA:carnitine CoA-transferase CaiB-like acyl-CoA transferase